MINLNRVFTASLLLTGLAMSVEANADATCQETRASYAGYKLEQRPNPQYVLLGNSVLSRFDSHRNQRVHFFQRNGTLPSLPQNLGPWSHNAFTSLQTNHLYLGSDKSSLFNGHVSQRFTPSAPGKHDLIAAFTKEVDVPGSPTGFFCVVHRYNVHGLPTLRENSVNETTLASGDVRFEANLRVDWAAHSEAAHTNKSKTITWHKLTQCLDSGYSCIRQNTGWQHQSTIQSNQMFSAYLMQGRYSLRATINDGVSTVTKTYAIDNSRAIDDIYNPGPPCNGCQIP